MAVPSLAVIDAVVFALVQPLWLLRRPKRIASPVIHTLPTLVSPSLASSTRDLRHVRLDLFRVSLVCIGGMDMMRFWSTVSSRCLGFSNVACPQKMASFLQMLRKSRLSSLRESRRTLHIEFVLLPERSHKDSNRRNGEKTAFKK